MAVSFIGGGNRRTPLTTGGELMLHMLHPSCYSLTTRTSSDMEIKNFISGMNPGMRNLKRINICGALNKPSLQGKWYRSVLASNSHNIISGLSPDALGQKPSDCEILRFSDKFDPADIRKLVIYLGLPVNEWKDIREDHPHNIKMAKFFILIQWRESKSGIFRDLATALTKMDVTTHKICQVSTGSINKI